MTETLDRSIAPEVRPLPTLHLPMPETMITPGGIPLTVLRSATCDVPVFQLRVVAGGLGCLDMKSMALAWLYPMMLNQGSENFDGNALSEIFEGAGAWLAICLQSHHLDITLRGLTDTAPEVVATLARMLRNPLFPADRLAVIAETRAMQRAVGLTQPKVIARDTTEEMFWGPGHKAALNPSPDELRDVKQADLISAHERFDPRFMSLYLSGNVTPGLVETIAEAFDSVFANESPVSGDIWQPTIMEPSTVAATRRITLPESRQAAISVKIPTIMRSHPDYEMLRLAVAGLGGYFGSRLNTLLREERGLTYGVSSSLAGSLDGAHMSIATECRTEAADEALAIIESELTRFVEEPPQADELKRLLSYSTTRLAAILDSPFTILDTAVVQQVTIGTPVDYFDRTQKAIKSATPDELARVMAEHIASGPRCIAIVS